MDGLCHEQYNINQARENLLSEKREMFSQALPRQQYSVLSVLTYDESIYYSTRSKKVELLAYLYDHAQKELKFAFLKKHIL